MATTKKTGTAGATAKKAPVRRKSATQEQIERLEKALEKVEGKDMPAAVPEEARADVEEAGRVETPEEIDFDEEVRKVIDTAEPSEEVKEEMREFEAGKAEFDKRIAEKPADAEEIVRAEIKRVEALKSKAEALKANIRKPRPGNEGFTSWWNGSSGLY